MGNYYRPIKTKRLVALLIRCGFVSKNGTKHGKYYRQSDSATIIIPRHNELAKGTSRQICECLEKLDIDEATLNKLF